MSPARNIDAGAFWNPGYEPDPLIGLAELGRMLAERDKARAAAQERFFERFGKSVMARVAQAVLAGDCALIIGRAEALGKVRLPSAAVAWLIKLIDQGDVEIREEPFAEPDQVYVLPQPRDLFESFNLTKPLKMDWPEPPQLIWYSRPTLSMDYQRPYLFVGIDYAYEPRARAPLTRREQHRAEVRAGLLARRARMRRRA